VDAIAPQPDHQRDGGDDLVEVIPWWRRWRIAVAIALWLSAIGLAAMYDVDIAAWIRGRGIDEYLRAHRLVRETLKAPGYFFPFTVVLAGIVWVTHPRGWRAAVFLLIASGASGVSSGLKYVVGRYRPYKFPDAEKIARLAPFELRPFPPSGTNLSFPSGHACLAFATACATGMLWPRWRLAFYAVAALVAVERVAENAHWTSDAVAAAAIGIAAAHVVRALIGRQLLSADTVLSPSLLPE
jgi:membrane-associated phospholipid phosphatase